MADDTAAGQGSPAREHAHFGRCCSPLKDAMSGADFEPLITVGEDDVLYMAVGLIDIEEDEPGMVDHPLFFCPFCGTALQTEDEVKVKVEKSSGAGD